MKSAPLPLTNLMRTFFICENHFGQEIDALAADGVHVSLPPTNDLRSAKAAFVNAYMEMLTKKENELVTSSGSAEGPMLTNSVKYKKAVAAWMDSSLRCALHSGKAKGFAGVSF